MLNTYIVLDLDRKTTGIPGQDIYHNSMAKSMEDRYKLEK